MINDIPEKYINSFYQWDNEKYYNQEETYQKDMIVLIIEKKIESKL